MDDQRKELRKLIAQLRPVQGARSTTREYRNLDEQNDARTVLEEAGLQFTNLRHRGEGRDPPDCEVEIDGVRCGIELTEFVHRRTLEKSIKAHKADSQHRYYPAMLDGLTTIPKTLCRILYSLDEANIVAPR